ncbi:MAG: UDP-glucose 4-epimerase GalE [Bacteroidota bacterium]|nr:UDP-glucose 4-epimerase GalE [Bacteroidota bacterium]
MNEQQILVTGGAGYIGSHTIVALCEMTGFKVVSVDNYSNSSPETYARIKSITGKDIEYLEADLSKKEEADKVFQKFPGITGIIHFAAFKSVPESVSKPLDYYDNNINSLLNLLEAGERNGVKHFIFSSSCSIYGNISDLPVNESTPAGKTESPYAYTKVVGEKILEDVLNASGKMKGIALRYFNPVGAHETGNLGELPNQRPNNLVPVITQCAIGKIPKMQVFGSDYPTRDGTCIRDYIHVCDIAEAHVKALHLLIKNSVEKNYDVINLGSGQGVTVLEAIHTFEKISGKKLNYELTARRAGDVEAIYSDCTKAETVLGWKAKRSLDEMMSSAWKWELNLAAKRS